MRHATTITTVISLLAIGAGPARAASSGPVGGGFLDAGLKGEYFANADLGGEPAFERKDIRVRFDWGDLLPVAGGNAPAWKTFPRDKFSVRWTGSVMPRFSEPYTFRLVFDEGARMWIKPAGAKDWTTLVDQWDKPGELAAKPFAMKANTPYEVKIEYRNLGGPAKLLVSWSSPSTPAEIVDSAAINGLMGDEYIGIMNADAFRANSRWGTKSFARPDSKEGIPDAEFDENNWPKCDWQASIKMCQGRHLAVFKGVATLTAKGGTFRVNDKEFKDVLPSGIGYNPADNTTTAEYDLPSVPKQFFVKFTDTQRDANSPKNTGITGFKLMRPVAPGATTYHPPGTAVNRAMIPFLGSYVVYRCYVNCMGTPYFEWKDRTRPDWSDARGGPKETDKASHGGYCYEDYILSCNETGRDLFYSLNIEDTPADFRKLALAAKYGTDGNEPYDHPVANPAYPPLNPNLNFYLEIGNEIWNYAGERAAGLARAEVANKTPLGAIIDYDGKGAEAGFQRWQAVKTVEMSKAFREVFGDEAMGSRIRVQIFGQYDSTSVLVPVMAFIDNYFNNGDGAEHVKDPHPVNYYVWGGGGATYYGNKNPKGIMDPDPLADRLFESAKLEPGRFMAQPKGGPWTFEGAAGVGNPSFQFSELPAVAAKYEKAPLKALEWRGFKFTVGPKDLFVYELGRFLGEGDTQGHKIALCAEDGTPLNNWNQTEVGSDAIRKANKSRPKGDKLPETNIYAYSGMIHKLSSGPSTSVIVRLEAGKTYYLLSQEPGNGDAVPAKPFPLSSTADLKITGAASAGVAMQKAKGGKDKAAIRDIRVVQEGECSLSPVNLRFVRDAWSLAELTDMPPGGGDGKKSEVVAGQTLVLGPGGSVSQRVKFPGPGGYCVNWLAAPGTTDKKGAIEVLVDGKVVDENVWQGTPGFWPGSSAVFEIPDAAEHTITIRYKPEKPGGLMFLNSMALGSVDAFFGGKEALNFPNAGDAAGEVKRDWYKRNEGAMAMIGAFGLQSSSYEGGMAVGGDGVRSPFMYYVTFETPLMKTAHERILDIWSERGGYLFQNYYTQIEKDKAFSEGKAETFPLVQGTIAYNQHLPREASVNAHPIPATLDKANFMFAGGPEKWMSAPDAKKPLTQLDTAVREGMWWISWNIIAPATGEYTVTAETAPGGDVRLTANESTPIATGKSGAPVAGRVFLTKGLHTIKIKATSGAFDVLKVEVGK